MTGLTWHGLPEMRVELRALPSTLASAHVGRTQSHANATAGAIAAAYAMRTGRLRAGVRVTTETTGLRTRAIVASTARHAAAYEHGSGPRYTGAGWYRGAMPGRPTLIPRMIEARRELERAAADDMRAAGLVIHVQS